MKTLLNVVLFAMLCNLSNLTFAQEKLDQSIMNEFGSGFLNAIESNPFYKARILQEFSNKYPNKDYYGIQVELENVDTNIENFAIVCSNLYDFYNVDRETSVRSVLKNNFLLSGESLDIIADYILEKKYLSN
jgi:hypothetical protein